MDANPYAPPQAPVADVAPPRLWRRSVLLMILLFVLTLGLYYPVWFLRRRSALNALDSPRTLALWPFAAYGVVFVANFGLGVASGGRTQNVSGMSNVELAFRAAEIMVWILMIVQCFIIKDIVEDHATGDNDTGFPATMARVRLSGLMTFFFQIFYLQWAINRYIADPQPTR